MTTKNDVIYWVHQESECVGICSSWEEFWELSDGLVEPCTKEQYYNFIKQGYAH